MHRLLVDTDRLLSEAVTLPKEAARHLKVLRPKPGECVELFDGRGRTRPFAVAADGLLAAQGPVRTLPQNPARLTLFACVTKGSRWDWTIEKAVELGVTRIVPVISERTIVRLGSSERADKAERWRRIAEDAARQSDAVWLPEIVPAVDFDDALGLVKETGRVFVGALVEPPPMMLLDAAGSYLLEHAGHDHPFDVGVFVGPEGDFTPDELARLLAVATPVSFGPTILRAETAAIYGVTVLSAVLAR